MDDEWDENEVAVSFFVLDEIHNLIRSYSMWSDQTVQSVFTTLSLNK